MSTLTGGPPATPGSPALPAPRPPHSETDALAWVPRGLLVDGAWREARSGRRLQVEDPATGRSIATVADASPDDCRDALAAAAAAGAGWARTPPRDRARILRRAAEGLRAAAGAAATVLTLEMGKPLPESAAEVEFAAEYLDWYADEAVRIGGREGLLPDGEARVVVRREPAGPCLIITPWNFPLAVPARGIAPALAAGCTAVLRPSAFTPLSALALARVLVEAGVPAGVLNVVISSEDAATDPLLADPRLRKLTFTGSEAVGRHLAGLAAGGALHTAMELGGCAPFIVFADADLDAAVDAAVEAKMRNGGAACTAASRFYVQRAVAPEFTRRLAAGLAGLRMGRGTKPGVSLGPTIGPRQREGLSALLGDAVARGATVVLRGGPLPGEGHFFAPVVLADVPDDARVMREESFGPIAPVRTFDEEDEVIALANACPQGLAAYAFTADLGRAMRLAGALEAGMTAINRARVSSAAAPFGGLKRSGHGRSGGPEGIEEYLVTRYVILPEM